MDTIWGVLLVYALPLAASIAIYLGCRSHTDRSTARALARAREEGLTTPTSLHPWIDLSRCLGCAMCANVCPEKGVLGVSSGKALLIEAANCVGHGACKDACPTDAIRLVLGTSEQGVEVPVLTPTFETSTPGIFVAGELGGIGLIRNAIAQGRQVIEAVRRLDGIGRGEELDVVIVGAGPAGFAATLAAHEAGLRYRTLEQDCLGGTVARFPRRKLVLTAPVELPIVGAVHLRETSREALLELWQNTERETGIQICYQEKVSAIALSAAGFVVSSSGGEHRCRAVVLALGRRGSPRKLGAEGEALAKVIYQLEDPADYRGQRVLVVGAGDSAVEAAISISDEPGSDVTLSCRGDGFSRAKPRNRQKIEQYERAGRVRVLRKSQVERVDEASVSVCSPDGHEHFGNDAVLVCIGGELPTGFLHAIGLKTEMCYGEP
jgi:thioredoxin reductase/Pyruvate/2-oxoacid:ferredoxin oxidoreductase delta subunit